MVAWFVPFLISLALSVVSYVITPKPQQNASSAVRQGEAPVAQAGMPIIKTWGTVWQTEPNVLWTGEMSTKKYKVEA